MPALTRTRTHTHTVVVPDLRGTGDSDRPEDGYAKTNQAEDIRGVLDALRDSAGPRGTHGMAHKHNTAGQVRSAARRARASHSSSSVASGDESCPRTRATSLR
ncbi:alpha/beta fold hydrolase [Streptomyces sp. NPDC056937]|uniref:alpha/beta fold hydrolase n=1 Tax=Streptomyces sp. NPDC056937 TaxID=3345969 RepID=UPI0036250870